MWVPHWCRANNPFHAKSAKHWPYAHQSYAAFAMTAAKYIILAVPAVKHLRLRLHFPHLLAAATPRMFSTPPPHSHMGPVYRSHLFLHHLPPPHSLNLSVCHIHPQTHKNMTATYLTPFMFDHHLPILFPLQTCLTFLSSLQSPLSHFLFAVASWLYRWLLRPRHSNVFHSSLLRTPFHFYFFQLFLQSVSSYSCLSVTCCPAPRHLPSGSRWQAYPRELCLERAAHTVQGPHIVHLMLHTTSSKEKGGTRTGLVKAKCSLSIFQKD